MNKWLKIILVVIGVILLCFILDFICIFMIKRPLFAVNKSTNVYRGIFYDTYICSEFSIPQIKLKGAKFNCTTDKLKIDKIIDYTLINVNCAEAIEPFYEDNKYIYYWECIKNNYMIVRYENGYEETVENALKHRNITIEDLDNYNISYIKEEK